jgi:hypothetical protein
LQASCLLQHGLRDVARSQVHAQNWLTELLPRPQSSCQHLQNFTQQQMGSKTKLISIYIRKVGLQQVSFRRTFWGTSACCKAQRKASTFARLHFRKSTECCAAAFHKLCP